jgi:hypothetical protein
MFEVDDWLKIRDLSRLRMEIRSTLRRKPAATIEMYLTYADQQMMLLAMQLYFPSTSYSSSNKTVLISISNRWLGTSWRRGRTGRKGGQRSAP